MSQPSLLPLVLQAVMNHQPRVRRDNHYPQWHLAPVCGLLNDPNGFIHFDGRYHLFYQWNPLACDHSYKGWGTGVRRICCTGGMNRLPCCQRRSTTKTAVTPAAR